MSDGDLPELLLIDKPKGKSSFDVIRILRRKTGVRKMGHAGTLDPLASGLMLIGVGKGTKKLADLVGLDKEYVADILLGERRTTGDMEGEIIEEKDYAGDVSPEQLTQTLQSMLGELLLPVSAYSAIKKDGVPMYVRARRAAEKGDAITEVSVRKLVVFDAQLQTCAPYIHDGKNRLHAQVRFVVSSGTYVRSLVEEVGKRLGYPAVMSDLRRTRVGVYELSSAAQLEDF